LFTVIVPVVTTQDEAMVQLALLLPLSVLLKAMIGAVPPWSCTFASKMSKVPAGPRALRPWDGRAKQENVRPAAGEVAVQRHRAGVGDAARSER
jgi:hypothetical protein